MLLAVSITLFANGVNSGVIRRLLGVESALTMAVEFKRDSCFFRVNVVEDGGQIKLFEQDEDDDSPGPGPWIVVDPDMFREEYAQYVRTNGEHDFEGQVTCEMSTFDKAPGLPAFFKKASE